MYSVVWPKSPCGRRSAFEKHGQRGSVVAVETGSLLPWLSLLESTMTGVGRLSPLLVDHFLKVTAPLTIHTAPLDTRGSQSASWLISTSKILKDESRFLLCGALELDSQNSKFQRTRSTCGGQRTTFLWKAILSVLLSVVPWY